MIQTGDMYRVNVAVRGLGVIPSVFPTTAHLMPETTPQAHVGLVPTLRARTPRLGGRTARQGQQKGLEPGLARSHRPRLRAVLQEGVTP